MSLLPYLHRVAGGAGLSSDDAYRAMSVLLEGEATPAQIAGFLVALKMKGETALFTRGTIRGQTYRRKARRLSFRPLLTHRTEAPGLDQGFAI